MDALESVSFRMEKTRKLAIDDTVLKLVVGADLPCEVLVVVRDLFLGSFYGLGMSLVDIVSLRQRNVERDVIRYRLCTTGNCPGERSLRRYAPSSIATVPSARLWR